MSTPAETRKPPYDGTRIRPVRIADPLWAAAQAEAELRGESVSAAIRSFLTSYSQGKGRPRKKGSAKGA